MYVFGGKDEDNEKLNDLWVYNLETEQWTQLDSSPEGIISRSGHSACVYKHFMLIFAGIHEITRELDDMAAYDLKENKWIHLFKEPALQ